MIRRVIIIAALAAALGAVGARLMADWPSAIVAIVAAAIAAAAGFALIPKRQIAPRDNQIDPAGSPVLSTSIPIEAIGEPALLIDADLRVMAANKAIHALIGDRIVGDNLVMALRHPVAIEAVRAARGQGSAIEREVVGVGHHDNSYRLRAVDIGDGRLLLSFADISQTRLAERMRVDFVANASHELRTPLATLTGFIETLQGPAAEDETARRRFLDIMAREAARMARLIDDLLSLSRIELDKYVRPRTMIVLPPLFAEVSRAFGPQLEADARTLTIEMPDVLPSVIADRDQVLQVLHNLVSNALKYGRTGTPVTLNAQVLETDVRITVADQGEGIASEHLPRLTERFYRVDTSRSRSMGGTGLGLAIVKHIVDRHRGALDIDSVMGVGTRVSFTLPAVSQK